MSFGRTRLIPCIIVLLLVFSCSRENDTSEAWDPATIVSTSVLKERRGYHVSKGIIHAHSVYSHDACDNQPFINNEPNYQCLLDLRKAICTTKQSFIMLTDHTGTMADEDNFANLLLFDEGDELIYRNEKPVANRMHCDGGASSVIMVGVEDSPTPLGLEKHVSDDVSERKAIYGSDFDYITKTTIYHQKGAVVIITHPEDPTIEEIREHKVDGMEIYNTHYNLISDLSAISNLAPFLSTSSKAPHPDLAFLAFFTENAIYIDRWNTMLAEQKMAGVGGTDVHQNTFPTLLRDGERADSYRRLMKWFSNNVLVKEDSDIAYKEAVKAGRLYVAFEAFGMPIGFDFYANGSDGLTYEMGGEVPSGVTAGIVAKFPRIYGGQGFDEMPEISTRIIRIPPAGAAEEVASGTNDILIEDAQPGAYRAEVWIVPWHLKKWLGTEPLQFIREHIWIYSNPIYVK